MAKLKEKTPVTATEFSKNFGHYRTEAQYEAIPVTSNGRVAGYFLAARDYEFLVKLARRMLDQPATAPADLAKFSELVEPVPSGRTIRPVEGTDQKSHWIHELGPDEAEALANAKMDVKHDHLNKLLDD